MAVSGILNSKHEISTLSIEETKKREKEIKITHKSNTSKIKRTTWNRYATKIYETALRIIRKINEGQKLKKGSKRSKIRVRDTREKYKRRIKTLKVESETPWKGRKV